MKLKRLFGYGLLCAAGLGAVNLLHAQEGGRRRGGDPSEFIKGMDKNGNGMIDPDEISERGRGFLGRAAEKAGLDMSQPLPVDKLTEGFAKMREERESGGGGDRRDGEQGRDGERGRDRDRGPDGERNREGERGRDGERDRDDSQRDRPKPDSPKSGKPLTPGFGVADTGAKAAGFDVPLGQDNVLIEKRFERRVIEYVDKMLSEQDSNKDGFIDNVEWKTGKWSTPPETSDTNNDKRLSKLELCVRISKRNGGDREANSSAPGGGSASGGPPGDSKGGPGSGDDAKYRSYAESLMKQFDADKSGMLEKKNGEWDKLKEDQREADANKDGVLTSDELIAKLRAYSSDSAKSASGGSSRSSSGRSQWWKNKDSASSKEEPKKSYRFLSPTERLPKGLPDWFARNDADADGQIMMAEFAAAWTETAATEFMKHDLDGDGVITPHEALASGGDKKK
jgi:hypothetical protein